MRNYKMVFAYDGSRYKGWQKLGAGELTIQGLIEKEIRELLGVSVEIHGSGRTDAGVHAKGQVASMKIPMRLGADFRERMNERLPEDIRLLCVDRAPGSFHARYSATQKVYRYQVDVREKPDVFQRKFCCHYPVELDVKAMKEAADILVGTYDFSSFTDDKSVEKDKVRTIFEIQILNGNERLEFVYRGDGFLQHMVRILTGTLLEVGQGKRRPEEMKKILEAKERAFAGFMVPAKGLFLETVNYE